MSNYTSIELQIIQEEESLDTKRKALRQEITSVIQKKVELRTNTIKEHFNKFFIEKRDNNTRNSVYLNDVLLKSAIKSYYYDIHKYKDFSGSKWVNAHKQAAYTIKWLVRFRPIQIKETAGYISEEIFEINLKFALFCGFEFLDKKVNDLIVNDKREIDLYNKDKEEDKKRCSFFDSLLYDLRYRHLSGKKLVLVFEALQLVAK
jgi:hypothetical protein